MNEGILTAYQGLPQWERLLCRLEKGDCTALGEIPEGERPFLAAALARETGRPVVLLAPGELNAQRHAQDIRRLTGWEVGEMPAREIQFSRAAMSRESSWQRLQTLSRLSEGKVRVLCLTVEALLDRCPDPDRFRRNMITLKEGDTLRREGLLSALLAGGYERVAMVEGRGQCALRGEILDVFPSNLENALRIEFFDTEIDTIRRFDCISQRSIGREKRVCIAPATEVLPEDGNRAADRLEAALREETTPLGQSLSREELPGTSEEAFLTELDLLEQTQDLEKAGMDKARGEKPAKPLSPREEKLALHLEDGDRLRAGQTIRTAPMWIHVLCEKTAFVTDYLDNPILLLDRPDQYPARVKTAGETFAQAFDEALSRGDAFEKQKNLRYTYEELLQRAAGLASVTLSDILGTQGRFAPTEALNFAARPAMPYQSRLEPLCEDLKQWRREGYRVLLLTGGEARGKRLEGNLNQRKTPCLYSETLDGNLIRGEALLLPVSWTKGFVHPEARLAVISDSDIYGTAYQRARKKQNSGEKIASFTDLKVGDYVVHDLHGVGIYRGVVQRTHSEGKRDYLQIEYALGDKLFVPADQFDRISKFIGGDAILPKLSTLGTGEWKRQKNKVRATLKELAFSLAELYAARVKTPGYAFSAENPWQQEFNDLFPYELTEDQQKSVAEIEADMEAPRNMDRLLCGDVGYGKTEVALRAAFKCVTEGKQAAMLAPTTILVQQHYNTIRKRFAPFPVRVEMLSRFRSYKEQKEILQKLATGEIDLIVGTHKLLGKAVKFKDLGLLIVDEEQRFGVNHKETIQHMKTCMDVLTLSATPIPRTLHMSMVGIRDMSLLETPPEERLPIKTYVTEYSDVIIREAIRREMARGGQVYFLYNRVHSIEQMHQRIKALVPDARVGIAHGQMQEKALEDVMLDFYAGAYDVLLCTTIVESGLDVPDANTLIVFDADRFGLSQLYQIRGRVGRSSRQAYAYFTVRAGKQLSETAEQRLSAIREFTEFGAGYRIAMRDLEIRGAGDILGPQQSGHMSTLGYDMYVKLIEEAVGEAQGIHQKPELDTRVELNINAYLPEDYVSGDKLRVEIYKRIAMVQDQTSRMEIEDELIDRFGGVPDPVANLMSIAQLRGITRQMGIRDLSLKPAGLLMRFDPEYTPQIPLLIAAAQDTDPRLKFAQGEKGLLLTLEQRNLTPERALALGISVLGKMLEKLPGTKEKS